MGRLTSLAVFVVVAATAGFTVKALTESEPHLAGMAGAADLSRLVLDADPHVTPLHGRRLEAGAPVRYSFRLTNTGTEAVRHVVARSVRVAEAGADGSTVMSVGDPACSALRSVECIFQRLGPGETRTVRVVMDTHGEWRHSRLVIRTFIGRFTGPAGGSIPLEVEGDTKVTSGWLS